MLKQSKNHEIWPTLVLFSKTLATVEGGHDLINEQKKKRNVVHTKSRLKEHIRSGGNFVLLHLVLLFTSECAPPKVGRGLVQNVKVVERLGVIKFQQGTIINFSYMINFRTVGISSGTLSSGTLSSDGDGEFRGWGDPGIISQICRVTHSPFDWQQ